MSGGVAAVVVNWNGLPDTRQCLRSLEAVRSEWSECIVVDNGSSDGSVESLRREFPHVTLLEADANLGYAGGNNLGIREALRQGAGFVFILNNDTIVLPGAVETLRRTLEENQRLALSGPEIFQAGAHGKFWYAGGQVSRSPFRARYVSERPLAGQLAEVDYVPGCAILVSREALERVGFFDERFFLTWEDTDLSTRAHEKGLGCVAVSGARVVHRGSASFEGVFSPLYCYYYFRNMLLFAQIHFPAHERSRAYGHTLRFARGTLRKVALDRERRRATYATALGVVHFALRRFGRAPDHLLGARSPRRSSARAARP